MDKNEMTRLMKETLEEGLSRLRGHAIKILEIQREPFSGSSSFSTERLRVLVNGDEWLEVFFKDLNPMHQLDVAKEIRKPDLDRSRRELWMYQQILDQLQLGTPQLFAFRWEINRGLIWLFLENAGPKRLSRLGDFHLWTAAAQWAARFHAAVQDISVEGTDFVIQFDENHYHQCVERLEGNLSKFDAQQRSLVLHALDLYRGIIDRLSSMPRCLIHGEFFGKNVMIRPGNPDEQIAVIDWETAAIGPSYVDLVSISAGRWTMEQRREMWRAYFNQYQMETGLDIDWRSFCLDLGHVALYRALWWLGWWSNGDAAHINRWVLELNTVMPSQFECIS